MNSSKLAKLTQNFKHKRCEQTASATCLIWNLLDSIWIFLTISCVNAINYGFFATFLLLDLFQHFVKVRKKTEQALKNSRSPQITIKTVKLFVYCIMLQNCPFHPPGEGWYWRTFTFFTNIFALLREQTSLDSKGAKVSVYCHHQPYTPVYAIFLLYWAWVVRLGVVACTLGWFKLRELPYSTREKFFKKYFFFWKVVGIKPCIQEMIRIRQLFWPSRKKKPSRSAKFGTP